MAEMLFYKIIDREISAYTTERGTIVLRIRPRGHMAVEVTMPVESWTALKRYVDDHGGYDD